MSTFHPRRLLLATAVASLALPAVAEEHGFLEDASANLNLRNFFFNRNYTNPTKAQGGAQEWTQSFILDAKSGFTQGTVARKSTRLNLSHGYTSYAVFRLKKKKKHTEPNTG